MKATRTRILCAQESQAEVTDREVNVLPSQTNLRLLLSLLRQMCHELIGHERTVSFVNLDEKLILNRPNRSTSSVTDRHCAEDI